MLNKIALFIIKVYRMTFSKIIPDVCRFYPSCSSYAEEAFRSHNFIDALRLTILRILRCNPYNPGGYDPVPEKSKLKERLENYE